MDTIKPITNTSGVHVNNRRLSSVVIVFQFQDTG